MHQWINTRCRCVFDTLYVQVCGSALCLTPCQVKVLPMGVAVSTEKPQSIYLHTHTHTHTGAPVTRNVSMLFGFSKSISAVANCTECQKPGRLNSRLNLSRHTAALLQSVQQIPTSEPFLGNVWQSCKEKKTSVKYPLLRESCVFSVRTFSCVWTIYRAYFLLADSCLFFGCCSRIYF